MYLGDKRFLCQIPHLLALGTLMLLATVMLKYSRWQCDSSYLERDTMDLRGQYCKDQFYQSVKLSPKEKISCSGISRGDTKALQDALVSKVQWKNKRVALDEMFYLNVTKDCQNFKERRRFIGFHLSEEEKNFPIAYSMVIHEKIEMFERLLRSIFAPQNVYCVHVDSKSPKLFQKAVQAIASCFDNVFLASKQESVVYASWSRVQADLNCMKDLLQSKMHWRYLLNTCGTDFPIKTNTEIVRALKLLNGKNNMESEKPSSYKKNRWKYHHEVTNSIVQTKMTKSPPPQKSPMHTGNAYIVVTREFVQHLFEDPTARRLIEWSKDTYSPDEHLWATLHRMPEVPGSVPSNDKFDLTDMNSIARLVKWSYIEGDISKGAPYGQCSGAYRRAVCVYGFGDLPWLLSQHHLFANKFDPSVDDCVIQCLEEYLRYKAIYQEPL
ncbi:beta-1,3-galactosyl-O-glycosyl-glycoprotein beta-1,6-N-acetylglucosaminyltransferase 3 [Protobothrops mucrosquamatus]|uniref:beta-1,3-galactosyl-O-glycosyl-glycoprotein beta-1,6-N-acetylglucosaminyltransferase 3 n=1 Tax=Protobothrops mucrosquamatus TaxID=103944 RepID=UPI00077582A3|nr:beta-1,3-galactosyl-O-glycosyl-glycoprotein beta-1,6-N-acetylglucosaminyltransferase 3 [Protobothrops mucrosquamatus]